MAVNLICIECPRGCELRVEIADGGVSGVTGNFCPKGKLYAETECVRPTRVLTTTARMADGRMLPVKTARPIAKDKLFSVMAAVNRLLPAPPVVIGQILAENISGTGANLVAAAAKN
ncbi:MAG: DUF1667 domain-containing protein [Clostridiales bacterium]|jgi:CxxC motif-containing protein|nr:DUF1667 domain-containing protein [Clostridiales bacterium]